jgi:small conductance mechanosensitive channel
MADFRYRREMLGPIEVWGLDRFDPNWMVVKGQIKTRPLQQWSVARAFNLRLKRKMDEAGIEIPVPQMRLYTSSKDSEGQPLQEDETSDAAAHSHEHAEEGAAVAYGSHASDASHASHVAHATAGTAAKPAARAAPLPTTVARDVSHEPRPAPPPTGQTAPIPPQIPTAGDAGGKSG